MCCSIGIVQTNVCGIVTIDDDFEKLVALSEAGFGNLCVDCRLKIVMGLK